MAICSWPLCFWDIDVNTSHLNSLDPTRGVLWAIIFARLGFRYFILHWKSGLCKPIKKDKFELREGLDINLVSKSSPGTFLKFTRMNLQQKSLYRKIGFGNAIDSFFLDADKPAGIGITKKDNRNSKAFKLIIPNIGNVPLFHLGYARNFKSIATRIIN